MSPEFIALIIGFATLLLSQIGVFMQLNARIDRLDEKFNAKLDDKTSELESKIDKLDAKIDKVRDELKLEMRDLSSRIDTVNSRLDNLYHELFKRDAA